ncbi:MAG: esterase family protein, partial [Lachnobacterium sp.]|nr:esterase family protein [Lachnobacterium sp.]
PQPSNPQPSKQIEVNCPASAMATRQGVAYGRYTHETYYSKTCRMQRGYTVLLPENYNKNKKYPVLYLLHGVFGDENTFSSDPSSKVREIFYNLARDGKARQWIVVMPNMFAATNPAQRPALTPEGLKPYDNFKNDLVNDLMPCIESRYSVLKGRDNTAIAGFSLGGRETLYTSISYPNLFSYAAAFSPAPGLVPARDWATNHPGSLRPEQVVYPKAGQPNAMKTVMVMCGTADSVVGQFPKSYHELLAKNGVSHIWYEVPGANHDNNAVHSGLYNFLVQVG